MVFESISVPTNLQNALEKACTLPNIIQNGDQYSININLNYFQLQEAQSSGINNYVQNCLQNLLQDNKGSMRQAGQPVNIPDLTVINSVVEGYSAIQVIDENGNPSYVLVSNINPNFFNSIYYNGYIFSSAQIICVIEQWSPMLLFFALITNPSLTLSPTVCTKIASQINTIPM